MSTSLPSPDELRTEVREWLRDNWSPLPKSDDPWVSSPERIAWLEN
ncbi:acyl-CoA dehydrogenase, partial [Mycolicibacterium elephantis]